MLFTIYLLLFVGYKIIFCVVILIEKIGDQVKVNTTINKSIKTDF